MISIVGSLHRKKTNQILIMELHCNGMFLRTIWMHHSKEIIPTLMAMPQWQMPKAVIMEKQPKTSTLEMIPSPSTATAIATVTASSRTVASHCVAMRI